MLYIIGCSIFRGRDSLNNLDDKDHKLMMEKLGIENLRAEPSGNPETINAVNSDESKARGHAILTLPCSAILYVYPS